MNKKDIFIRLFQMAEEGELNKTQQSEITNALISLGRTLKPNEVNQTFKKMRLGVRQLLEQTEECFDSALDSVEEYHEAIMKVISKGGNLPNGATIGDDAKTISFIKSLEKDIYNFSEAYRLTGISRQTIKKHADGELYNLRTTRTGKSEYITRSNLIEYYRSYYEKDGLGY